METEINHLLDGTGTPLLFQHGLTANVNQVETLLGGIDGLQLMSIDCPGHGGSPLAIGYNPSFDNFAEEVIRFLDRKKIDQAIFGGISMGSGIAINIALHYPERVLGLILVRPAWLDQHDPKNLQILLQAADLMHKPNGQEEFCQLQEFSLIKPPAAAQSVLGVFSTDQQPGLSLVIRAMVGDRPFESLDRLKQINKPTLVIGNHEDPLHPYAMAEKIKQSIPGSVLRKVTSRYIADPIHSNQVRDLVQKFIQEEIN